MSRSAPRTFLEHMMELRHRLFWVVIWFIITSGAVFPFFGPITKLLMQPLGDEKLYYLTPIGGLGFMIKVSMYLGLVATLPAVVYHCYKFIAPVVRKHSTRRAIWYVSLSFIFALIGVAFAYLISLPAAMHFLTHIDIQGVTPMLTVDSYLSFIVAYLLAGALLFQLPIIMSIVDSIKPTPPKNWLKYERHMIVAAFIVAMLITPTPSIIDQAILALPIMVMYQVGIMIVWLRHRKRTPLRAERKDEIIEEPTADSLVLATVGAEQAALSDRPLKPTPLYNGDSVARHKSVDGIFRSPRPMMEQRRRFVIQAQPSENEDVDNIRTIAPEF